MSPVLSHLRAYAVRRHVRPWALAVPVAVILFALPLLRPILHPHPDAVSDDELARLATVQAIVEYDTLAINQTLPARPLGNTISTGEKIHSDQPPVFAALLSVTYWVLHRWDITMANSGPLVAFILTVLGVTVPVAGAAGLIYRMGRLFELDRRRRTLLAGLVVFGGGLLSYATVLNSHAPAAAALIGATACLIHISITRHKRSEGVWVAVCGFCTALAGVIDLAALPFLLMLPVVVLAMPWSWGRRIVGLLLFLLGALPPLMLHATLTIPVTGDILPGQFHRPDAAVMPPVSVPSDSDTDDLIAPQPWWSVAGMAVGRLLGVLLGSHGVLSHFPLTILGMIGVFGVMHRHWPTTTKLLAASTAAGVVLVLFVCAAVVRDWREAMFANRWAVTTLPLLIFWAGVWLRRAHRPLSWGLAAAATIISVAVTVIGATSPQPPGGYSGHSAVGAAKRMIHAQDARATQGG